MPFSTRFVIQWFSPRGSAPSHVSLEVETPSTANKLIISISSEANATATIEQLTGSRYQLSRRAAGRQVWAAWYSLAGCRDSLPRYRQPSRVLPPQAIARIIWQLTSTTAAAIDRNSVAMATWWKANHEYAYNLLDDADCNRVVADLASASELDAYQTLKTGVQRADLARVLLLREIGGVYADTDMTVTHPLRAVLPANATMMVLSPGAVFEVIMSAPNNPLLSTHLEAARTAINAQAGFACGDSPEGCHGYIGCIHNVTGPHAYRRSAASTSARLQCTRALTRLYQRDTNAFQASAWPCNESPHPLLRGLYVLQQRGGVFPTKHSVCHDKCATKFTGGGKHYSTLPEASVRHGLLDGHYQASSAPGYFQCKVTARERSRS